MKWYYTIAGGHTHARVFMNGGKCGELCFRNDEFVQVMNYCPWIRFIEEPAVEKEDAKAFLKEAGVIK